MHAYGRKLYAVQRRWKKAMHDVQDMLGTDIRKSRSRPASQRPKGSCGGGGL